MQFEALCNRPCHVLWQRKGCLTKLTRVMRLTAILLLTVGLHAFANSDAQTITYSARSEPLERLFTIIHQQTGYAFFYDRNTVDVTRQVTVELKNSDLSTALSKILPDQSITWSIKGNTVFIVKKERAPVKTAEELESAPLANIHGRITDSAGRPLAGAYVVVRSTRKGTFTNANGEFDLDVHQGDRILVSYIGYQREEFVIGNQTNLNIRLAAHAAEMDSVAISVNTGYQRIRPEQSTGAISTITTREYETRISTDFLSGLTNKLSGLMINNNIKFQGNNLFQIRGISTISGNPSPLIVVDGYPTELSLNDINPNEIESVTILKDAAAAAIYGVRASNGVIIIERKKAKVGATRFNFRTTLGIQPKENYTRYKWAPPSAHLKYLRDNYKDGTVYPPSYWNQYYVNSYTAYQPGVDLMLKKVAGLLTQQQEDQLFDQLYTQNNIRQYEDLFLRTAVTQQYNLDMSGGTEKATYYITGNYLGSTPGRIDNNNRKLQLTGRTIMNFTRKFSLDLTTDYIESWAKTAPIPSLNNVYPSEQFQDAHGNPLPIVSGSAVNPHYDSVMMAKGFPDNLVYPLVDVKEISDKTHVLDNRVTANFAYHIGYGFNFTFGGIYENSHTDTRHYASGKSSQARQYVNKYAQNTTAGIVFNIPPGGYLQQQNASTTSYTGRAQLNYDRKIGRDHSLNAIIGGEVRRIVNQASSSANFGYDDQTLLQQPIDYNKILGSGGNGGFGLYPGNGVLSYPSLFAQAYTDDRYVSMYSNIVYSFRNKYSLSGSIRIDESDLFGTDPRYRHKPLWSLGANWNIQKEKFMENADWVNSLKLRVADGFDGNVSKSSLPQIIANYSLNPYSIVPELTGLVLSSPANKALRWEQTQNVNFGLDYTIFKDVSGSIDYYNKKSTDVLGNDQIDPTRGVSQAQVNSASLRNSGIEISLHADWIKHRNFVWNTGFVLSRNTSKVLKVYQAITEKSPSYSYVTPTNTAFLPGYAIGSVFSYRYGGLDSTGLPMMKDEKGNLVRPTGANDRGIKDVVYGGSAIPVYNGGISNRVDIGHFYFYCMIGYYFDFKVVVPRPSANDVRPLAGAQNYWKQKGDEKNTDVLGIYSSTAMSLEASYSYSYNTKYTVNGAYLTLSDLTASYDLRSSGWTKRAGFTSFELKAQASNVYTIGLNRYNYSMATGSFAKRYLTPSYTIGLFTNF